MLVAGAVVILAAIAGCGTFIARFALTQLLRAAGIDRPRTPDINHS